jgi:hypothetical protein
MMSDMEKKAFYADIPSFMHHFPHIWIHKQEMEKQRQMMMAQQQRGAAGGGGPMQQQQQQQMMQSGIIQLMGTEEGRSKVQSLSSRIMECRERSEAKISSWGTEEKKSFFDSFNDLPALKSVNITATASPMEKIETFLNLSDSDLDSIFLMQLVLADDIRSGGTMTSSLLQNKDEPGSNQKHIFQTLGTFKQMAGLAHMATGAPPSYFSHDHAHAQAYGGPGHVHGPHCQHGGAAPKHDVSSGKKEVMDR